MDTEGTLQKLEVCLTSLSILPKQMAFAKLLEKGNIHGILKIKNIFPYKVFIQFNESKQAESIMEC